MKFFSSLRVLLRHGVDVNPAAQNALSVVRRRMFGSTPTQQIHSSKDGGEDVLITVENGIRTIKFNRPQKKNAITRHMAETIIFSLQESNTDDSTNLVVITGEGDHFTSGIDLSSSPPPKLPEGQEVAQPTKRKTLKFVTTLIDVRKPLIALVNGPAHGIGVTMLGLCDAVYCSDQATFTTNFTRFGLPPECCSTYTFPKIMGYPKANELLIFCNKLTASDALTTGLVSHVFPHDHFQQLTSKKLLEMASFSANSMLYTKELVRGREKELLNLVHRAEQEKFDVQAALLVKRNFEKRTSNMSTVETTNP